MDPKGVYKPLASANSLVEVSGPEAVITPQIGAEESAYNVPSLGNYIMYMYYVHYIIV